MPPLPTTLQDGLLSALQTAFRYHAEDWLPLRLNGLSLGFVNEVWRKHLIQDWPNPLHEDSDGLHLFADNWIEMGRQLEQLARRWHDAGLFGSNHVGVGQGVVQVPGKHVTHAGLAGLKAPQPIHHAAVDTSEHTRNLTELRPRDDVASRSTQNSG